MPLDLAHMNLEERSKYLELKERYKKKLRPWFQKWWGITILVILAIVIILATISGLYIWNEIQKINTENTSNKIVNTDEAIKLAINGVGTNYTMGTTGAPLTIVEFADFACPFCQKAHLILKHANAKYPGKLKIVYRDMPLHANSIELALAARCAGEQKKFWEMHDLLFENQTSLTATGDELAVILEGLASTLGIDQDAYKKCYSDQKYLSDIGTDFGDSVALNLGGTPSWFLNGKNISGYIPEEDFFKVIDSVLANIK